MIGPTGIWTNIESQQSGYPKSLQLAKNLANILNTDKYIIDFGCGDAYYIDFLRGAGFQHCIGIDGHTPVEADYIFKSDLSKPRNFPFRGQVISLEVGEHIPLDYEQPFIYNLCHHCDSQLIVSWAVPDQPGLGHVNCRENKYIIRQISKHGFAFNKLVTAFLRDDIEQGVSYFRNTIMVFDRFTDKI